MPNDRLGDLGIVAIEFQYVSQRFPNLRQRLEHELVSSKPNQPLWSLIMVSDALAAWLFRDESLVVNEFIENRRYAWLLQPRSQGVAVAPGLFGSALTVRTLEGDRRILVRPPRLQRSTIRRMASVTDDYVLSPNFVLDLLLHVWDVRLGVELMDEKPSLAWKVARSYVTARVLKAYNESHHNFGSAVSVG